MEQRTTKKGTIDTMLSMAIQIEKLKASGNEREALELQAKLDQMRGKFSRVAVKYDPWLAYEAKHFAGKKQRWEQARRSAHGDTGGTNGVSKLAAKFEAIYAAGIAAGRSVTELLFECAAAAKGDEANHYVEARNQIGKLQNEDQIADLVLETEGDLERAKLLAKARKVKFAKIYETAEQENSDTDDEALPGDSDTDMEPDSNANGAATIDREVTTS